MTVSDRWRYEARTKTIRAFPSNHWIATMDSWDGAVNHEANSHKIAAAPQMLDALQVALLALHANRSAVDPAIRAEAEEAVRKAIVTALGVQPAPETAEIRRAPAGKYTMLATFGTPPETQVTAATCCDSLELALTTMHKALRAEWWTDGAPLHTIALRPGNHEPRLVSGAWVWPGDAGWEA